MSHKGDGKGHSATGRAGGRRKVKGAGTGIGSWKSSLILISSSQSVALKHKGWDFGCCWGKLRSRRLSTAPFLCGVENHGKITNQSSDTNKKSG